MTERLMMSDIQYKYKCSDIDNPDNHYHYGIEYSSDLEGVFIDHIKWYLSEEERDKNFNNSEAIDANKIMENLL
jgi:hypothetical protein